MFVRKRDAFFKGVEGFDRVPIEFLAITCEFYEFFRLARIGVFRALCSRWEMEFESAGCVM